MIALRLPAGAVRTAGQRQWLNAVEACPAFAGIRADRWTNLRAVAQVLAAWMDWRTSTSRPGWAVIKRETGLSRSTIARCLADLHRAGLLGTVASGRSAGTDPHDPHAGNMAAVYVLAVPSPLRAAPARHEPARPDKHQHDEHQGAGPGAPDPALTRCGVPGDKTDTPSLPPSGVAKVKTPARARDIRNLGLVELVAAGPWWPAGVAPTTKPAHTLAAAELRRLDPVLRRASTAAVTALAREWHRAGWTITDIRHALNNRPDGTAWPHQLTVADVRHVPGWFRYRMRAHRSDSTDPASPPALSPGQRHAAEAAAAATRTHERHQAGAAQRAAAVPPPPTFEDARDVLRHRRLTRAHRQGSVTHPGAC